MKRLLAFFAKRYIAGERIGDAIKAALALNASGILATIDNLGENVSSKDAADETVREYFRLLDEIKIAGAKATVSLKLTHLGLDISDELTLRNAEKIIAKALTHNSFVRFDMEGSAYTQRTIDLYLKLRASYPNVGIAIQTCLKRSPEDVKKLIEHHASVRLVKGAYKEPKEIAFEKKRDVDKGFDALMKELLLKGNRVAIATHDERLIREAIRFAGEHDIPKNKFDFEMLLGIKRGLQRKLAKKGYSVRVYVPYGTNWLPYTMRRLRERKENVFFLLKNIFD